MSKKRRKARRPNGKRPAVVVSKPSQAQLVALAKQAGKLAARSLAQDMKKLKRGRRVKNAVTARVEAPSKPLDDSTAAAVISPSSRALSKAMRGTAIGGGYGRRGSRATPAIYTGAEQKRDDLLLAQEQLDLLQEMANTPGIPAGDKAALEEEMDEIRAGLSVSELALLESAALQSVREKEIQRRFKKAQRAHQRGLPLKKISDSLRGHAIAAIQMAGDDVEETGNLLKTIFDASLSPLTKTQAEAFARQLDNSIRLLSLDNYDDLAPVLLSTRPDILQQAIELLETDFATVPALGASADERKWNILHRKLLSRLRAAQQGRVQNPSKRGKSRRGKRRPNVEIDPKFMLRAQNPRKRKRGRKGNPLDMGYQVRAENGRRRRKSRRSRKHNPSLSDFQLLLQGGSGSAGALLRQTAFGAGGFMLSGLAESLISGDVVSALNLTSYLPDALGKGKQMLASALAAALSGVAVWGAGKGVAVVRDNAPGLYIGIGLRLIRNLVDHATRGNASMQGLRNLADLPQLGAYGCGAWNPAMNGYYNFQPVMNGYYNYQPALSGYYNYQPALSGPPEMGYQLSGSPASNPFGQPF